MGIREEVIRDSVGSIFDYLKEKNIDEKIKEKIKKELYIILHYIEG